MFITDDFGFKKEEIDAIESHFYITLDYGDWESMQIVDYELEDDENHLNLPTGRLVYFPDKLIRKDMLAQMD